MIGRNEARHLPACLESLRQLVSLGIETETIFVDSASKDGSTEIARGGFDKVIRLEESPFLNAGVARNVGTHHATGRWVLYLDGDMELAPEILEAIKTLVRSGPRNHGLCGLTENVYPDGGRDLIRFRGNRHGEACRMFGGTVLLPRRHVLDCGNWPTALFAYEESELYSRLIRTDCRVVWHECRMVLHKAPRVSIARKLWGSMLPYRSFLGKKYYGAGQVTLLTLRRGHFRDFARLKPDGYVMIASILIAALLAPWLSWSAIVVPSLAFLRNTFVLGPRGAVNSLCWIPQVMLGMRKLKEGFQPRIESYYSRAGQEPLSGSGSP
ncbi:MAG: glycosyltransferase family A protein [Steroidobacteraceae bacterium]